MIPVRSITSSKWPTITFVLFFAIAGAPASGQNIDFDSLIDAFADAEQSYNRMERLRKSIELSLSGGHADTATHQLFVESHASAQDEYLRHQDRLKMERDRLADAYRRDPQQVQKELLAEIQRAVDTDRFARERWLGIALDDLDGIVDIAPDPIPLPEEVQDNRISRLQRYLLMYHHTKIDLQIVSGEWNQITLDAVRVAIRYFEIDSFWGLGWYMPPRGVLTDELAAHLDLRSIELFEGTPNQRRIDDNEFFSILLSLQVDGIYDDRLPEPPKSMTPERSSGRDLVAPTVVSPNADGWDSSSANPKTGNPIVAFFRSAYLVFLLNWTDELEAFIRSRRFSDDSAVQNQRYQEIIQTWKYRIETDKQYPIARLIGGVLGGAISAPGWIFLVGWITIMRPTPPKAIMAAFIVEIVEGLIMDLGDLNTLGYLQHGVGGLFEGAIISIGIAAFFTAPPAYALAKKL